MAEFKPKTYITSQELALYFDFNNNTRDEIEDKDVAFALVRATAVIDILTAYEIDRRGGLKNIDEGGVFTDYEIEQIKIATSFEAAHLLTNNLTWMRGQGSVSSAAGSFSSSNPSDPNYVPDEVKKILKNLGLYVPYVFEEQRRKDDCRPRTEYDYLTPQQGDQRYVQVDGGITNTDGKLIITNGESHGKKVINIDANFLKGDKGDKGDQGDKGDKGDKGDTGNTGATIDKVEVEKTNETTAILNQTLTNGTKISSNEFELPRGLKGDKGDKGDTGDGTGDVLWSELNPILDEKANQDDLDHLENVFKDEISTLDNQKQNKLTAGENIKIENDVISTEGGGIFKSGEKVSDVEIDSDGEENIKLVSEDKLLDAFDQLVDQIKAVDNQKQDKLTAGENIKISADNTISATSLWKDEGGGNGVSLNDPRPLNLQNLRIQNVGDPVQDFDAVHKQYLEDQLKDIGGGDYEDPNWGDAGDRGIAKRNISMGNYSMSVNTPTSEAHAASKFYVDNHTNAEWLFGLLEAGDGIGITLDGTGADQKVKISDTEAASGDYYTKEEINSMIKTIGGEIILSSEGITPENNRFSLSQWITAGQYLYDVYLSFSTAIYGFQHYTTRGASNQANNVIDLFVASSGDVIRSITLSLGIDVIATTYGSSGADMPACVVTIVRKPWPPVWEQYLNYLGIENNDLSKGTKKWISFDEWTKLEENND